MQTRLIAPHLRPIHQLHLHVQRGSIERSFPDLNPAKYGPDVHGVARLALDAFAAIDELLDRATQSMIRLATSGRVPGVVVEHTPQVVGIGQPRTGGVPQAELVDLVRALEAEVFASFRTMAITAATSAYSALAQLAAHAEQLEAGSDREFAEALHAELTAVHEAIELDADAHPLAALWPRCVISTRVTKPKTIAHSPSERESETP